MERMAACGIILAGGQSSRMGVNKAFLEFDGRPLVSRLAERFQRWFRQTAIVTNTPEAFAFLGLPMAGDRVAGLGPLSGLEAGLKLSAYERAFFCAVDMPFISEGLVRFMIEQSTGHDIVVPWLEGEYEPMHAVYSKACLPAVTRCIDERRLRLISIFEGANLRPVTRAEVEAFGDPERLFFNCNTPADLEKARQWLTQEG